MEKFFENKKTLNISVFYVLLGGIGKVIY